MSSDSRPDKVTIRVEVVVEGGRASAAQTYSQPRPTRPFSLIAYPQPCSTGDDTPIVLQSSGMNYIEAWGESPTDSSGNLPSKVWAKAYPQTGVGTSAHKTPDAGAVQGTLDTTTGHWSFLKANSKAVPNAQCDSNSCGSGGSGSDNSTLLVWWEFDGSDTTTYQVASTAFHGYCSSSGSFGSGATPATVVVGSHHLATTLHATFTGTLARLGTVALLWNGVSWAGVASGGEAVLSFSGHAGAFQLLSAGPGTSFLVAAQPRTCPHFSWAAEGAAYGVLAGGFGVTITE